MHDHENDLRIRRAAFAWLQERAELHGDVFAYQTLKQGFELHEGERISLCSRQGIHKPRQLGLPLTIRTSYRGPYKDAYNEESGLLTYDYRGNDPDHRDNRGLREAMRLRVPLAYLHQVIVGKYLVAWPVFVEKDNPSESSFLVAIDYKDPFKAERDVSKSDTSEQLSRKYATAAWRVRLHQRTFRERVLRAYREQCAFCRLKRTELLEASHIIPDSQPQGEPHVNNGLSLCKLHHAAFDKNIIGIKPNYVIEIRQDVLQETDGPMLVHGLQAMHEEHILLPRRSEDQPSAEYLARRYDPFCQLNS